MQKLYKPHDLFVGVAQTFSCLLGCLSSAVFVSCQRKLGDRLPLFELKSLKSHISELRDHSHVMAALSVYKEPRQNRWWAGQLGQQSKRRQLFVSSVLLIVSVCVF